MSTNNDARPAVGCDTEAIAAIGMRVRSLRAELGMTLQQLSAVAGVSQSMLSMVERGKASASIGTLFSVANALGVPASDLLSPDPVGSSGLLVRGDEQPIHELGDGVTWRVVRQDRIRGIEIAINEYAAGKGTTLSPIRHEGYEYGIVLEGCLTAEVGGVRYEMSAGDCIAFNSTEDHRLWNYGGVRTRALWIILR